MAPNPAVIASIEASVASDPANFALRVHLADLLLDADRGQDALAQLEVVLQSQPDDIEALGLAGRAALIVGDPRAPGWKRLHQALTGSPSDAPEGTEAVLPESGSHPDPPIGPVPAEPGASSSEEPDWDRFLKEVLIDAGHQETITLADVGGLVEVKDRLEQSFLGPLRNPELRRAYGAHLRGGLLLWGPPGCGKTFLARAVAGELGAQFVPVGLHQILDMWLGNSEKQLHELFEAARRNTPCVLFFDEVDAIGHTRTDLGRSAARNVVAQLLVELDGVETSNEGIFVIGATNQPWDVDPALRRPGRFDRTMLLLPPDADARAAILRYHLRDRPVRSIDYEELANLSEGMSGADLRLICDDAAEQALSEAIRTTVLQPIENKQLRAAIRSTRPSTAPWLESARNYVRYANSAGEYDELANYLRRRKIR
jgi:SpoVK/Ycf46/Vps4 family AAA+-type ATPase